MKIDIPYSLEHVAVDIPDKNVLNVIKRKNAEHLKDEQIIIRDSLLKARMETNFVLGGHKTVSISKLMTRIGEKEKPLMSHTRNHKCLRSAFFYHTLSLDP
jgi:hypothetical protein